MEKKYTDEDILKAIRLGFNLSNIGFNGECCDTEDFWEMTGYYRPETMIATFELWREHPLPKH